VDVAVPPKSASPPWWSHTAVNSLVLDSRTTGSTSLSSRWLWPPRIRYRFSGHTISSWRTHASIGSWHVMRHDPSASCFRSTGFAAQEASIPNPHNQRSHMGAVYLKRGFADQPRSSGSRL
jgi:hypothetical protein